MPQHFARTLTFVAFVTVFAACAGSSGFHQPALRDQISTRPVTNDTDVADALALRPQLPKPFRLGVFFRDARSDGAEARWRWNETDKQALLTSLVELQKRGEASDVFIIGSDTAANDGLPAIRLAAARHGADAVLVVSGIDEADVQTNAWGVSYVALVPMVFIPGSSLQTIFVTSAELWDVRNEYLYAAAHAEAEAHQQRPLAWVDRKEAATAAQKQALGLLGDELRKRLAALGGA